MLYHSDPYRVPAMVFVHMDGVSSHALSSRCNGGNVVLSKLLYLFQHCLTITGSIEMFSANKKFKKILKVSHFYLEFSWSENHNKIK